MKRTFILLFSLGLFLLCSCASRKDMTRSQQEISLLQQQILLLKTEQERLNQTLAELKRIIEQNNETVYKYQADTKQQLRQLSEQSQILSDRLDEIQRQSSRASGQGSPPAPIMDGSDISSSADRQEYKDDEVGLYQAAYQDLVNGKYELARQGFGQFLVRYPNSEMADNAQYWIGESYYAQQQFEEAARAFQSIIHRYPQGDKISAALLKLAYSQISLNQRSSARKNLEKLINEYPASNEAALARTRLKELQ